jgi:AcrR family transcriptional regulator
MDKIKNTKTHILEVALKLFAENSYHGASIRDIAKEIGKRESSIYNHFKSKEEIFEQIISNFSSRNFGPIILTDKLINNISKPEKFFTMLGENLILFWNSEQERMFIKILLGIRNIENSKEQYTLENYLEDFRNLCDFIFKEMISHKFIKKFDVGILSQEFISPLFLFQIELLHGLKSEKEQKSLLKNHVEFFWEGIKR